MQLDTAYYERCISTLEKAYSLLLKADPEIIDYDMYRSACIKEFEIILEQSGKLLKKVLKPYFHSAKATDELTFKNVFRNAVLRGLINDEACERWLIYRDNRNHTAHDYGINFAQETLFLLPGFIEDAKTLAEIIRNAPNEG